MGCLHPFPTLTPLQTPPTQPGSDRSDRLHGPLHSGSDKITSTPETASSHYEDVVGLVSVGSAKPGGPAEIGDAGLEPESGLRSFG